MSNKEITIFGLGAIGSNVGFLLQTADPRLVINGIDKDVVEQRNIVNQIYSQAFIGQSKVDAFVAEVFMRTQNMPKGKFVKTEIKSLQTGLDLGRGDALLVDAFDNFSSRDQLHKIAYKFSKHIVHLGFGIVDKNLFGTVQWNETYQTGQTDGANQDVCELADATWWIKGATALMTKNILDFLRSGKIQSILIRSDLSTKIL